MVASLFKIQEINELKNRDPDVLEQVSDGRWVEDDKVFSTAQTLQSDSAELLFNKLMLPPPSKLDGRRRF